MIIYKEDKNMAEKDTKKLYDFLKDARNILSCNSGR